MSRLRVGVDIGGVLSKYPEKFKKLMSCLVRGGAYVCIVTDMTKDQAREVCDKNGLELYDIFCADWNLNQELCKTYVCNELNLDFLIDDFAPYLSEGNFIGLCVSPRPRLKYENPLWVK